jgi:fructoselysine 6-phosphate deglycase
MPENRVSTEQLVIEAVAAAKTRESVTDIYFVACGGSYALMLPNQYAVDRLGKGITGHALNAAEFKARSPARLGKSSIVILCSLSGTTPETVEAAKFARAAGALTISLTSGVGSPLDEASEHSVFYKHEPLTFKLDHAGAVLAQLTFGILAQREGSKESLEILAAVSRMPELVDKAVASHSARIREFGEARRRETVVYTMASGSNFGAAYSYSICILQEMQWMHSAAIHAGEYFHGPFEITDSDVPFLVLRSIGTTKEVDDRAITFAKRFSTKVTVLDAEELGLGVIKPEIVEYVEHLMFSAVLRNYAQRLSFTRGHPLTVRRYMWQIEY